MKKRQNNTSVSKDLKKANFQLDEALTFFVIFSATPNIRLLGCALRKFNVALRSFVVALRKFMLKMLPPFYNPSFNKV